MIEVFVRSSSPYMDVGHYRELSQHVYCSPDLARWAADVPEKFKGRILPEKDRTVLESALRFASETGEQIVVFDVSRVSDRLKAIKRGVKSAPTVIIDGKKYDNAEEILRILQAPSSKH
ncbi:MAG: hypothetical protein QXX59_01775 [Candidatus Bathyarchaeia archaeon]